MKAVVKFGQEDGMVELRDVDVPRIGPGDVLLEVKAAGICGSDIEMWQILARGGTVQAVRACMQGRKHVEDALGAPGYRELEETYLPRLQAETRSEKRAHAKRP